MGPLGAPGGSYGLLGDSMIRAELTDGVYRPLITAQHVLKGQWLLKVGKCTDSMGINNEVVQAIAWCDVEYLADLYSARAEGYAANYGFLSWIVVVALMLPKIGQNAKALISDFRPIAIIPTTLKLYLIILMMMIRPFIETPNFIQHGNRKGHQAAEVILIVRLLVEKSLEWGFALIFFKTDILKAHDRMGIHAVIDLFRFKSAPMKLTTALIRELTTMLIFLLKL